MNFCQFEKNPREYINKLKNTEKKNIGKSKSSTTKQIPRQRVLFKNQIKKSVIEKIVEKQVNKMKDELTIEIKKTKLPDKNSKINLDINSAINHLTNNILILTEKIEQMHTDVEDLKKKKSSNHEEINKEDEDEEEEDSVPKVEKASTITIPVGDSEFRTGHDHFLTKAIQKGGIGLVRQNTEVKALLTQHNEEQKTISTSVKETLEKPN
jgi:hypothetical protein